MDTNESLRRHLVKLLDWQSAHASFDAAVEGVPAAKRDERPEELPYSPWDLVEHMRIAQRDILDFCRDPEYRAPDWPTDYWPPSPGPESANTWNKSIEQFRNDRRAMQDIVRDDSIDLHAQIPHGDGQTYLREVLLVADHNAYHLGQLVAVRRMLGIWK